VSARWVLLTRRFHAGGGSLRTFGSHRIRHATATLLVNNGMPLGPGPSRSAGPTRRHRQRRTSSSRSSTRCSTPLARTPTARSSSSSPSPWVGPANSALPPTRWARNSDSRSPDSNSSRRDDGRPRQLHLLRYLLRCLDPRAAAFCPSGGWVTVRSVDRVLVSRRSIRDWVRADGHDDLTNYCLANDRNADGT